MSRDDFLLEAEGVYKSYRMGTAGVRVLKGVNLAVRKGDFVAIVGASGSGKSTLLHILGTLDKQDKGVVRFEGQDLSRQDSTIFCPTASHGHSGDGYAGWHLDG